MEINYKDIEKYVKEHDCTQNEAIEALMSMVIRPETDNLQVQVEFVQKEDKKAKKRSTKEFKGTKRTK